MDRTERLAFASAIGAWFAGLLWFLFAFLTNRPDLAVTAVVVMAVTVAIIMAFVLLRLVLKD